MSQNGRTLAVFDPSFEFQICRGSGLSIQLAVALDKSLTEVRTIRPVIDISHSSANWVPHRLELNHINFGGLCATILSAAIRTHRTIMKFGAVRFDVYLTQLSGMLADASAQTEPGLMLYTSGARTPIFMLEGLAKLYAGIHDRKIFAKIGLQFKVVEDALGSLDYYDAFAKEFKKDPAIPVSVTAYAEQNARDAGKRLNDLLGKNSWITADVDRIAKVRKKLDAVKWLRPKAEIKAMDRFYRKNIKEIQDFWASVHGEFTDVETQVHSLRRKLRWLSIYPQAVRGCIQLTDGHQNDPDLSKYLTPEIVNSPYNKLPLRGANRHLLVLNRDYFLAISWLIAELGRLKDDGLRAALIMEASDSSNTSDVVPGDMPTILAKASSICRVFFDEGILENLIGGTVKTGF
ncbi:MAG: hypothetical protein ABJA02_04700 [Acidobacteriota bacterium]